MNKLNNNTITKAIIIAVCLIALIPIFYLALYSRPCVDDYTYSASTHDIVKNNPYNIIGLIRQAFKTDYGFFISWQGLYSSAFILSLQPGIYGEQYYFIGAWLLIILMIACLYYFICTLTKIVLKTNQYAFTITLILLMILLTGLPSLLEGIYWYNGAWNYMPFFFLTLVNISLLLRFLYLNKKHNIIYSTILSFIISGGNHVTAFLNIIILAMYYLVTFKKNKKGIIPLASALIGFIIVYFAPGTRVRQDVSEAQGTIETVHRSLKQYFEFIGDRINIQWVLVLLLLTILSYKIYKEKMIKKEKLKYNPIILLALKIGLICACWCVPFKALGYFGSARLWNVIYCAYMILSCLLYIYIFLWISFRIGNKIKTRIDSKVEANKVSNLAISMALVLLVIGTIFFPYSNSIKATREITSGRAKEYAEACDKRYKLIEESQENIIYVESLPENIMLNFDDITQDKDDWRNVAWKNYYHKTTIRK